MYSTEFHHFLGFRSNELLYGWIGQRRCEWLGLPTVRLGLEAAVRNSLSLLVMFRL